MNEETKNQAAILQTNYTVDDMIIAENHKTYSMFGQILESNKLSAPCYTFSRADRKEGEKIFTSKSLIKTQFLCKGSPGPIYKFDSNILKANTPSVSISLEPRGKSLQKPYIYYGYNDSNFDPDSAKIKTLSATKATGFKTTSRVNLLVF